MLSFNIRVHTAVISITTMMDIFHPSLNIYLGCNPYPTGIALIEVGSIYDKFTPTEAI